MSCLMCTARHANEQTHSTRETCHAPGPDPICLPGVRDFHVHDIALGQDAGGPLTWEGICERLRCRRTKSTGSHGQRHYQDAPSAAWLEVAARRRTAGCGNGWTPEPDELRRPFKRLFALAQRGGVLKWSKRPPDGRSSGCRAPVRSIWRTWVVFLETVITTKIAKQLSMVLFARWFRRRGRALRSSLVVATFAHNNNSRNRPFAL